MNTPEQSSKPFSDLLDDYITEVGLSDARLAWKVGVSRHTIIRWRTGEVKQPSKCDKVREVAKVLKLTSLQRHELLLAAGCQDEVEDKLIPVVGKPVISPKQLFGQQAVLERIKRVWSKIHLENIALIGPRGSGKTSLLHYLENITTATSLRPNQPKGWDNWLPNGFQFAIINFHDPGMCHPETLIRDVLEQLNLPIPDVCDLECFANILKRVETQTIIMMDEIGAGLKSSDLDANFWYNFRFLTGHCANLGFFVTAREPIEVLAKNEGKPSPFFNLFGNILALEPFTKSEALEFLDYCPKTLFDEDREWMLNVLDKTGYWPVLLQHLCDERLLALEQSQTDEVWKNNALERIKPFLQHLPPPKGSNNSEV
jgi:DNA-binding XRE family transcriptional regulator/energy-coupling factor transporter ATP-binding protein EcfA2